MLFAGLSRFSFISKRVPIEVAILAFSKIWTSGMGLATAFYIAASLEAVTQGYYYLFTSLGTLQFIVELGIGVAIIQLAASENARTNVSIKGSYTGSKDSFSKLNSLMRFIIKWFSLGSVVLVILLMLVGTAIINKTNIEPGREVYFPYYAYCISLALIQLLNGMCSFFEGCGFIKEVALVRLTQAFSNSTLLFALLFYGFGLYAMSVALIVSILLGFVVFFWFFSAIISMFYSSVVEKSISFIKDIFPFQKKLAASWFFGYLMGQLYVPMIAMNYGPEPAGEFGFLNQLISGISSISILWMTTKFPTACRLYTERRYDDFKALFYKIIVDSYVVYILIMSSLWGGIYFFDDILGVGDRLPSVLSIIKFSFVSLLMHFTFIVSMFFRAKKEEVYIIVTAVAAFGVFVLLLFYLPTCRDSVYNIYLVINSFIFLFSLYMYKVKLFVKVC